MAKLYLSPSTQEHNIGVGDYGIEETYCNLVTDLVEKKLRAHKVELKRNRPEMTLKEVVKDSNAYNPDLHFAIHTNATGHATNTTIQGCMVLIHKAGGQREVFGKILYDRVSQLTPWKDRGILYGENWFGPGKPLYELAYTSAPAALIEIDFHDNLKSVQWLLQNIPTIADTLANAVLDYFKIPIQPAIDPVKLLQSQVDALTKQLLQIKEWAVGLTKLLG